MREARQSILIDVVLEVVANRSDDDVAFLVKASVVSSHLLAEMAVGNFRGNQGPTEFFNRSTDTGSTDNDTRTIGYFKLGQCFSQF